jgi:hypothetical protein
MTQLTWDQVGERLYETGVDHGVLYLPDDTGEYAEGVAWNGLTTVTESPSGAESNPQYADNIKYLNLISAEEFGGTIEAFTYPDEFSQCDGTEVPIAGVVVGQQGRRMFGLAYRTQVGNDLDGTNHGYKLHLIYGAQAAPSEKAYATINDSPEAITFSWEITTNPVPVTAEVDGRPLKPTAQMVIDSTKVDDADLQALEDVLFGTESDDPRLPLPDEIITMFTGEVADVDLASGANQPTFNEGTGVITLPAVTGVQWTVNGTNKAPGAQPALTSGQSATVRAKATSGYNLDGDDTWSFEMP